MFFFLFFFSNHNRMWCIVWLHETTLLCVYYLFAQQIIASIWITWFTYNSTISNEKTKNRQICCKNNRKAKHEKWNASLFAFITFFSLWQVKQSGTWLKYSSSILNFISEVLRAMINIISLGLGRMCNISGNNVERMMFLYVTFLSV